MLYKLATLTGYRRPELGVLRPTDFDLDTPAPVVQLGGEYTKNGEPAEQPIPMALAAELRPWLAGKATDRPVFDPLPEKTGQMLKADPRRAGIDPGDARNVVDMHSFRHGYVTLLIRSGANLSTVQKLARHSTPDLTSNTYTHLSLHDAAAAVERLPVWGSAPPENEAQDLAVTGTDGPDSHISKDFSLFYPYGDGETGRIVSPLGGSDETTPGEGGCRNSLDVSALDGPCRDLAEPVASVPRRTRTYNPLIKSQQTESRNLSESNELRIAVPHAAHHLPTERPGCPPDLALIVDRWVSLPEALRAGIVAMVRASLPAPENPADCSKSRPGKGAGNEHARTRG
jgi:Phage integrase family